MKAVFLDRQTFSEEIDFSAIEAIVTSLTCYPTTEATEIIKRCQDAEIIITNKVVLTEAILKSLPKLQLICVSATGTNNVDIPAATALGIKVTNVSGYSNNSVAQYVFSQILEYYSSPYHHQQNIRQGVWQESRTFCYHGKGSIELAGKTLGIIGYGSLGKSVAKLAEAFGMQVLIAERKGENQLRNGYHQFDEVLTQSDIITLHCPQTKATEQMVNTEFLNQMKSSALLINTARGPLIDNSALLYALNNNTIGAAVLDVLEVEPPPKDHILLTQQPENLIITAHIAWASNESQQRLIEMVADNITAFQAN